ncbi:hypothetical protein DRO58_00935 [Candidatus Bathyarchaeota archaeon]|nr:MAG: hypothetical protein DRO58_00935 [Candidatus Bathyarchaeota archaeon]
MVQVEQVETGLTLEALNDLVEEAVRGVNVQTYRRLIELAVFIRYIRIPELMKQFNLPRLSIEDYLRVVANESELRVLSERLGCSRRTLWTRIRTLETLNEILRPELVVNVKTAEGDGV